MELWWEVLQKCLLVGLGGFLGANARYWMSGWIQARSDSAFPWSTFVVNILGSFVLALFMTLVTERLSLPRAPAWRLVFAIGFVGSYTTFSALEWETWSLITTGSVLRALGNAFGSLIAGFMAVWLGVLLGRFL